jgi:hypothetical protein
MDNTNLRPEIPQSHRLYASIVHWITIAAAVLALFAPLIIVAWPERNVLEPGAALTAIFNGAAPEQIWALSASGVFPGAHYYFDYPLCGDSLAQMIIVLGCSVGVWALIPAAILQFTREKDWFYATVGSILAALMLLAMLGLLRV